MMIFCNFERKSNHIMMTKSIFDYAMLIAWVLYLFMGGTLLWSKVPDKELYRPYKKSLILVAIAFLAIGINIMMGWLSYTINLDVDITIAFNFVSYYIIYVLLGKASLNLYHQDEFSKRQLFTNLLGLIFLSIVAIMTLIVPKGIIRTLLQIAAISFLFLFVLNFILRFSRIIREMRRKVTNYCSKPLLIFSQWLTRSAILWVLYGLMSIVIVFSPRWAYLVFMIIGILINIYIFLSLQNYVMYYENVERAFQTIEKRNKKREMILTTKTKHAVNQVNEKKINWWIDEKKFTQIGITINQLAQILGTNRNYLSAYINKKFENNFSDWICSMRLEYAKQLLLENRESTIEEISMKVGFSSGSYFTKVFTKNIGKTPAKWRDDHSQNPQQ
jgi:AraC-like DNA-binding protein